MSLYQFELKYQLGMINPNPAVQRAIITRVQDSLAQLMRDLRRDHGQDTVFVGVIQSGPIQDVIVNALDAPKTKES